MVKKSTDNSVPAIAPFLTKCFDMVDDESTDVIISWSQAGNSFVIWNMTHFTVQLLPKYFKHGNFSSFIRQLNIYGFKKIDTDRWEFANDGFIRGQKHLLRTIVRRKHPAALNQHKSILHNEDAACDEIEDNNNTQKLWKEVESLKTDKNVLMQELNKLTQIHESTEKKLLLLRERLQGIEENQQQMLSFIVMILQSPDFFAQLLQSKENHWQMPETDGKKKKNMLEEVNGDGESDGMIVRYQPWMEGEDGISSGEKEPFKEFSDDFFLNNIDFLTKPADEQFPFHENLSDLTEDNILKQIHLGVPFLENNMISAIPENSESDLELGVFGSQIERLLTFESLSEEMENYENLESTENSQNLDHLTEQLRLLISETDV